MGRLIGRETHRHRKVLTPYKKGYPLFHPARTLLPESRDLFIFFFKTAVIKRSVSARLLALFYHKEPNGNDILFVFPYLCKNF